MSIPFPGTYRLRNVQYPNQMFDLEGGSAAEGTPVIGYANNNRTQNMLVSVNFLTQRIRLTINIVDLASGYASNRTVRMINVASGTFAQQGSSGSGVMGSPSPAMLRIMPRNNQGEFSIQTTDGQLACSLANGNDYTQVAFQKADGNNNSQGRIFCPA